MLFGREKTLQPLIWNSLPVLGGDKGGGMGEGEKEGGGGREAD